MISIDGDHDTHNQQRLFRNSRGSFDSVSSGFRMLQRFISSERTMARLTITRSNLKVLDSIDSVTAMGFGKVTAACVFSEDADIKLNRRDYVQLLKSYRNTARIFLNTQFGNAKLSIVLLPLMRKILRRILHRRKSTRNCGAGTTSVTVSPSGHIYACHRAVGQREFLLGDVFTGNIDHSKRSIIGKLDVDNRPVCSLCWARYICGGGCIYESYLTSHSYNPVHDTCFYLKKLIELALYLSAEPEFVRCIEQQATNEE